MARRNLPGYLKHKTTGQAYCVICGHFFYLGKYGSKASRVEYERIIGEYLANGKKLPPTRSRTEITIEELVIQFLEYAAGYYVQNGKQTLTVTHCRYALAPVIQHYGKNSVSEFGPLSLKFIREIMVKEQLARSTINSRIGIIKQMFRWGVENELVSSEIFQALLAVTGLKKGRSEAVEPEPVELIADEIIEKTLPFCPPIIADMIQIQRYGGLRPQDVINLRSCDIDRTNDIWKYVPHTHKTKHRGKERMLPIGPRTQRILEPYLIEKAETPDAFLFSPADTVRLLRVEQRQNRKTKVQPSQICRKKSIPKRKPSEQYNHHSYRTAIHRACDKAGIERWSPNRIRHTTGTEVRDKYGLDYAQALLGHATAKTTEIYAQLSYEKAAKVAREIG
jgi:integrase